MSEMFISVAMLLNTVGRQYNAVLTAEFDKNFIFYFTENNLYLVIHNDRLGFEYFFIIYVKFTSYCTECQFLSSFYYMLW